MSQTLHAQQQALQRAILDGRAPEGLLRAGDGGLAERFDIYASAYRVRLRAALRDNYPVLHQVLGDEAFAALAAAYLAAHPSAAPSIRWFGSELAAFAIAEPDCLPHPALVDLIRLEWALRAAFDAEDAPTLAFGTLAVLPPERWPALRLRLHPSVSVLDLAWSVEALWQAVSAETPEDADEPVPHPHALVVWRRALTPCWRSIEAAERGLFAALVAGEDFAGLCARLAAAGEGDTAAQAATILRLWVAEGLLRAA